MSAQVLCESPRIIIHPRLPELLAIHKCYVFRGKMYDKSYSYRHVDDFNYKPFNVKQNDITKKDLEDCYVVDKKTGETYPIYLQVPCGHCDVCKVAKINSFVKRCEYETECYSSRPWFVTLTYAPEFVPSDGVSVREAQLFLKRFRINLVRAGYPQHIRYVLVGEYGTKTHRPHYHAIFWNVDSFTTRQYFEITDILSRSWNKGFIQRRLIDPSNDKGFYYTSKYLKKDCFVPDGMNSTFMLSSRGHGGIGAHFLDKHCKVIRKSLNCDFKFFSRWRGKVVKLQWSRYVINRLFPSFCRSVNTAFRNSLRSIVSIKKLLYEKYSEVLHEDYRAIAAQFNRFFWVGEDCYVPSEFYSFPKRYLYDSLKVYMYIFNREFNRLKLSVEDAFRLNEKRQYFLSKLFMYEYPVDIKQRVYACNKIINYQSIYQIL